MVYRRYSTAYVDQEAAARRAKRGIWRGEFVPPWDWRRGDRLKAATRDAHCASAGVMLAPPRRTLQQSRSLPPRRHSLLRQEYAEAPAFG